MPGPILPLAIAAFGATALVGGPLLGPKIPEIYNDRLETERRQIAADRDVELAKLALQKQAGRERLLKALRETHIPPSKPGMFEINAPDGKMTGGLTELPGTQGALISAWHVVRPKQSGQEQETAAALARSFEASGRDLNNYSYYKFSNCGLGIPSDPKASASEDIILFVPKQRESATLDCTPIPTDGTIPCETDFTPHRKCRLIQNPHFQDDFQEGDFYYSYQYGTNGQDITQQVSLGEIAIPYLDPSGRFILPSDDGNHSTHRSSGSVVYTTRAGAGASNWKLGGVVQCIRLPTKSPVGVPVPGGVRVISFSRLTRCEVTKIPMSELLKPANSTASENGPCIPIDGKWAGGT